MLDEDGLAKLGDFGITDYFPDGNDTLSKTEGTYHFLAPECCDPDIKTYSGKAADIWALGVTLYSMVFNELPFWGDTEIDILEAIHKTDLKISEKRHISEGLKNLLMQLLEKDPLKRIEIGEVKKNLWINEGFVVNLNDPE